MDQVTGPQFQLKSLLIYVTLICVQLAIFEPVAHLTLPPTMLAGIGYWLDGRAGAVLGIVYGLNIGVLLA